MPTSAPELSFSRSGEMPNFAFLTSSQVMLMLPVQGLQCEKQGLGLSSQQSVVRHWHCPSYPALEMRVPKPSKGDKCCPKSLQLLLAEPVFKLRSVQHAAILGAHRLQCSAKCPRSPGWYLCHVFPPTMIIPCQRNL